MSKLLGTKMECGIFDTQIL